MSVVTTIRPRQGEAPPHNVEAEQQALGKCLLDSALLLGSGLEEADFYLQKHKLIWRALLWLEADGLPVDTVHLGDHLEKMERLAQVGGRNYLLDLTDTIPAAVPTVLLRRLRRERDALAIAQRVQAAVAQDDLGEARRALARGLEVLSGQPRQRDVEWREAEELFAELGPTKWLAKGLQVGPGRPCMLAGYGASAKTLASQALAMAIATGTPAWGHFETQAGTVAHLDYEQGFRATARRYQRLAIGHGIPPGALHRRLKLAVMPTVYLDSPDAIDAYARICEGVDFVVLDALKGATPTMDENDSSIRVCLDNLTRVSEKTGTIFWVLHHAGKPKDGHTLDPRTILRGSGAIFDACGSVFVVIAGTTSESPRRLTHVKPSAEAEGSAIEPFELRVEDVTRDANPTAGVRVVHQGFEERTVLQKASDKYAVESLRLLDLIRSKPGASFNTIAELSGMQRSRCSAVLGALTDEARVIVRSGPNRSRNYYVEVR